MTLQTSVSASSGATKVETPDSEVSGSAIAAVDDRSTHATIKPPADHELWSYVEDDGKRFLQFSAVSRICLGSALVSCLLFNARRAAGEPQFPAVVRSVIEDGAAEIDWSEAMAAARRTLRTLRHALAEPPCPA